MIRYTVNLFRKSSLLRIGVFTVVFFSQLALFAQQDTVQLFAHRGGKLERDENTIAAFEDIYNKGLRGFEIDVRMTKDHQLVIFHDADLKRIVGIDGAIEELTLKQVKALRTKQGNKIPTLDEAVSFFNSKPGLYVEFEMKTNQPMYDQTILEQYCDDIYKKVHAKKPKSSTYLSTSFDKRPLVYFRKTYPEVELLFIKGEALSQSVLDEAKALDIKRIGCRIDGTSRSMVTKAKEQGFIVSLWPGLSIQDFVLGVSLGAQYLCTDIPEEVYNWTKEKASWINIK